MKPDHPEATPLDAYDTGDILSCEDIQPLLFAYMTRELGQARADVVREHIRKCEKCQAAGAEIQATLDALRGSSELDSTLPDRLSDKHRERIIWAFTHPVMDWIDRHHVLVSVLVAILVIGLTFIIVRVVETWPEEVLEPGPTVIIGEPPADYKPAPQVPMQGQNSGAE